MKAHLTALALLTVSSGALAQAGGLFDAEVVEQTSIDNPAAAVRQVEDGWFAFGFPALEGTKSPCCWKGNWKRSTEIGCSLEKDFQSYGTLSTSPEEDTIVAYARIRRGEVTQLKIAGEQCPMDADGLAVTWIGDTDARETLDWLESLARNGREDETSHPALWALALHANGGAGNRLYSLAREHDSKVAEEAVFWLGEARGEEGFQALESLLDELPAGDTRRHVNFALSQNDSADAAELLGDIARNDRDPEQRADALFWLAQEYPEQAEGMIQDVIKHEKDRETLERAVFAMSQLPPETAGPMLLDLAKNPDAPREARRQALFWLAQEGDEDSVAELTEMLTR